MKQAHGLHQGAPNRELYTTYISGRGPEGRPARILQVSGFSLAIARIRARDRRLNDAGLGDRDSVRRSS